MKKSRMLVTVLNCALLLAAGSAMADGPKAISWDEFVQRCANPTQFPDIQVQPANIVYECTGSQTLWIAEEPGSIPMSGTQSVTGAVISSKFTVAAQSSQPQAVPGQDGSCPRYKEVVRTLSLQVPVTCDDILGGGKGKSDGKGGSEMSPEAFCAGQLGTAKGTQVQQSETGREISTCSGVSGAVIPSGK